MPRFDVSLAAPHELLPACRLLFTAAHAEHSCAQLLSDEQASGLFVAREGRHLRAAALTQSLPGAMGIAYPTRGDSIEAQDAATIAACVWLRDRGVKVCQAFAAANERKEMAPLERAGFRHVTQLVSLQRDITEYRPETDRGDLTGIYYQPGWRERFERTLLATHTGTLDCPELTANRADGEIIAGFSLPDYPWSGHWLATTESDVGVFCVEPTADRISLEVLYLGVVPAARGRGYGNQLVRRVLFDASVAGFASVTLSVDVRNVPAMKLYARHGFVEYDRREVWLATWPG